ncbi:MAG: hypothetical protein ABI175_04830 [Polyangiales bacterium]
MKRGPILLATGALALLGAGLWLGRSSSATAETPAAVTQPAQRTAALPRTVTAPAPTLAPKRTAPSRALAADLTDGDPKIRRAAIKEVARDPSADPAELLAASRDVDIEVGILATEGLARLHAAGNLPAGELIARAGDHALNERVRVTAMNGLAGAQTPESAAYLAELLARGDTFERINAAILIGHQDPEIAMPALIRALGDGDERVRSNAVETLRAHARGRDFGSDAGAWASWWQSRPR